MISAQFPKQQIKFLTKLQQAKREKVDVYNDKLAGLLQINRWKTDENDDDEIS